MNPMVNGIRGAEAIADVVLFFVSDAARLMTGHVLSLGRPQWLDFPLLDFFRKEISLTGRLYCPFRKRVTLDGKRQVVFEYMMEGE